MRVRTFLMDLLVICGLGIAAIGAAAAEPAGPPAGYQIYPENTQKSPDGTVTIEQYLNKETDDWKWLFFARTKERSRSSIRSRPATAPIFASPTI